MSEHGEAATGVPEHHLIIGREPATSDLLLETEERLAGIGRIPDQAGEPGGFDL